MRHWNNYGTTSRMCSCSAGSKGQRCAISIGRESRVTINRKQLIRSGKVKVDLSLLTHLTLASSSSSEVFETHGTG